MTKYTELEDCEIEKTQLSRTPARTCDGTFSDLSGYDFLGFQILLKDFDRTSNRAWGLGSSKDGLKNYWKRVRIEVQEAAHASKGRVPVTNVLMLGDSILRKKCIEVIMGALHDVLNE